jgi:hypothetical protein
LLLQSPPEPPPPLLPSMVQMSLLFLARSIEDRVLGPS